MSSSSRGLARDPRKSGLPRFGYKSRNDMQKGYTLPELIIYVAILAMMLVIIFNMFVAMTSTYRHIKVDRALEVSAGSVLERVVREVRTANTINPTSVLGTSPGTLILLTNDDEGDPHTLRFYLENDAVMIETDSGTGVPLTTSSIVVTSLIFRQFYTGISFGVQIELTLASTDLKFSKSETFYAFAMLRNSY